MSRLIPSTWRWAVAPLGALLLAMGLSVGIAPRTSSPEVYGLRNWGRSEYDATIMKLFALRDSAQAYRMAWELADTRERAAVEPPAPTGLTVRADANVPSRFTTAFGDIARAELTSLTTAARHPVVLRLLVDSTANSNFRRAVVIPATAASPCVVHVRLSDGFLQRTQIRVVSQVLGVCGLYAKFGAPGEGMTKFLTRTSLATAGAHTSDVPRSPFDARTLRGGSAVGYEPFALACAVGRLDQCKAIFEGRESFVLGWMGDMPSRVAPPRRLTNAMRIAVFSDNAYDVPRFARLAALRATLGDDRFSLLWASKDEPAVEFARREGRPLDALVSETMRGPAFRYHRGSAPYGWQLAIGLLIVAAFVAWAVAKAPREYRV
jgi:hypothetical protein